MKIVIIIFSIFSIGGLIFCSNALLGMFGNRMHKEIHDIALSERDINREKILNRQINAVLIIIAISYLFILIKSRCI